MQVQIQIQINHKSQLTALLRGILSLLQRIHHFSCLPLNANMWLLKVKVFKTYQVMVLTDDIA